MKTHKIATSRSDSTHKKPPKPKRHPRVYLISQTATKPPPSQHFQRGIDQKIIVSSALRQCIDISYFSPMHIEYHHIRQDLFYNSKSRIFPYFSSSRLLLTPPSVVCLLAVRIVPVDPLEGMRSPCSLSLQRRRFHTVDRSPIPTTVHDPSRPTDSLSIRSAWSSSWCLAGAVKPA